MSTVDVRFDPVTKSNIVRGYLHALQRRIDQGQWKLPLDHPHSHDAAELFVRELESAAENNDWLVELESRRHQDRQRAMDKMKTAAGKLLDAFEALDGDALAYLYRCAAVEADGETQADTKSPLAYFIEACTERPQVLDVLGKVHRATVLASRTLPKLDKVSAAAGVACGVGNVFFRHGLEFPVSETGLAVECMEATFELAGMPRTSVRYWIQQGREHPWSQWNVGETSIFGPKN